MATGDYTDVQTMKDRMGIGAKYVATTVSFTASTKTITDTALGLKQFKLGDLVTISGSASNNGTFNVTQGDSPNTMLVAETLVDEAAGATVTLTKTTDPTFDVRLAAMITAASRQIDEYCQRWFYPITQTRYYTAEFPDMLKIDDCLSISNLAVDIDGDRIYETVFASTDYDLEPYNAPNEPQPKPYTRIRRTPYGRYILPIGIHGGQGGIYKQGIRRGIQIAGVWGYSQTTPPLVSEACILRVQWLFHRKDSVYGILESVSSMSAKIMPRDDPDVCALLSHYLRTDIIGV